MAFLGLVNDVPQHQAPAVDPGAFKIAGAEGVKDRAKGIADDTNNIQFDWTHVDAALQNMAGAGAFAAGRADGQNLTAGTEVAMEQDSGMEVPHTAASLAQALMAKGKSGAMDASKQARANAEQQSQATQFASQLQQSQLAAKMQKAQMQLELQSQKFNITNNLTQATNALTLTQASLQNAYNNSLAGAKNATEAMNLGASFTNNTTALTTASAALGAAAAGTAALAGQKDTPPAAAAAPKAYQPSIRLPVE